MIAKESRLLATPSGRKNRSARRREWRRHRICSPSHRGATHGSCRHLHSPDARGSGADPPLTGRSARAPRSRRGLAELAAWVDEIAALTQPDARPLGRRLPRRERRAAARDGRRGQAHQAQPRVAARLVPRPLAPERRRPHRGAHLHRLGARGGRRPDEQLGRPRRDPRDDHARLRGLHARPHDVRRAVLDGPRRRPALAHRRAGHRQRLRRHLDRHHDARRHGRPRARSPTARTGSRPCTRSVRRSLRASRTSRGPATTRSTSCTSPRRSRSGRSAPATAATRSSPRSASRCASPPSSAATRAGSPSTCCSSA